MPDDLDFRPGSRAFYGVALAGLFLSYLVVFSLTLNSTLLRNLANSLVNVAPVAVLGFAVRSCLLRFVFKAPPLAMAGAHLLLAILFAMAWFWLLMVLLGAMDGNTVVEFSVRPFMGPAAVWQLYQGLTLYALIALLVYAETLTPPTGRSEAGASAGRGRIFVKQGDDIRPLDVAQITLIRGADDYSEVITRDAKHLVRVSLSTMALSLGDRFLRVHRSYLVNVDHLVSAEPAGGGRMLVNMDNGESIQTSRTGARLLRQKVV